MKDRLKSEAIVVMAAIPALALLALLIYLVIGGLDNPPEGYAP